MSYHSEQFLGQSNTHHPKMAQGSFAAQHPGPLSSNPPFRNLSVQHRPGLSPNTSGWNNPESSMQANLNSNSWMPSAHQFLNNTLQASGFGDVQAGTETMGKLSHDDGTVSSILEPPVAPPNSPVQSISQLAIPVMPLDSCAVVP